MTLLLIAAILAPILTALFAALFSNQSFRRILRVVLSIVCVALAVSVVPQLDHLSAIFMLLVSVLSALATIFSAGIFPGTDDGRTFVWSSRPTYFILIGMFWSSMLLAVTSTSFIGIWIGISSTTIATTFLVGFSGAKASLEAAWKYLMLCSFGLAFALLGLLLVGRAAIEAGLLPNLALSWSALAVHAQALNPSLMRAGLLLMLVGFGTKAGLVPMHAWLPDAHSKAPAPVSALLSGLLVSCALYALIRTQAVAAQSAPQLFNTTMLVIGGLTILVAAMLMLAQSDMKRLLSYSTIEHAGLVAIALGIATPLASVAALLHILNHAFVKSAAFLSVGLVQHEQGSTTIARWHGLWHARSGRLFLLSLIGLAGLPPLGLFLSELLIIFAAVNAHAWLALAIALTGLLLAFAALARCAIETESGTQTASAMKTSRLAMFAASGAAIGAIVIALLPLFGVR